MKFYLIDYLRVRGNKRDGWKVGYSRIGKRMFCCRSLKESDVIDALCGWGVLPKTEGYKMVREGNQLTIFEKKTEKPVCAFFRPGVI